MCIGQCDLEIRLATDANSCCTSCNNNPKCNSFSYMNNQCYLKSCNTPPTADHMKVNFLSTSGYIRDINIMK